MVGDFNDEEGYSQKSQCLVCRVWLPCLLGAEWTLTSTPRCALLWTPLLAALFLQQVLCLRSLLQVFSSVAQSCPTLCDPVLRRR